MEYSLEQLEKKMSDAWFEILNRPIAKEIQKIFTSGDKRLYALWLVQVVHMTRHTSAHQAIVGTRFREITHTYMKFCFEHALEEVGHEMMAFHDLKQIGVTTKSIDELPSPLSATEKLNAYLYYVSEHCHPTTRLGFSYWAEKCYPFIQGMASTTQKSLGLSDSQMTFFVSHSNIDEKHSRDVEHIIRTVCKTKEDWRAVEEGMVTSLDLAIKMIEDIYALSQALETNLEYKEFLDSLNS